MKIQFKNEKLVVFESALWRTTSSLIIGNDYLVLVDPNYFPLELEYIQHYISGIGEGRKKYIVFTHSDYDHIIGYNNFRSYSTIASVHFKNNINKKTALEPAILFDLEYYIERKLPLLYPNIDTAITGDPQSLMIQSNKFVFYQATGHNKDGILFFDEEEGILITGDYLSNIEFPFIYDSVPSYMQVLHKLKLIIDQYDIRILVPGHGDCTTNKNDMILRIEDSMAYIESIEKSVRLNVDFDNTELFTKYKYSVSLLKTHNANLDLVRSEISKSK